MFSECFACLRDINLLFFDKGKNTQKHESNLIGVWKLALEFAQKYLCMLIEPY